MAETVTIDRPPVAKPVSRPRSRKPATVSASALALHLDCSRTYIGKLEAEGVIQRQGDGFPLDQSRVAYLRYLRRERRQSPRSEADADFQRAKSELIRLRIAEKQRHLIPLEEAVGHMDEVVGLFLIAPVRASRPGAAVVIWPRAARSTKPCLICGLRYPKPRPSWRISAANRHWTTTHDDRRDDRRRSRGTGRARRPLHCRLPRDDRGDGR